MKKINLNSTIKVKLTPYGVEIYYHQYDELNERIRRAGGAPLKRRMPAIDEDGFASFQLHYFMNLFGEYMKIGCRNVIEKLSIYVDDEDMEEL